MVALYGKREREWDYCMLGIGGYTLHCHCFLRSAADVVTLSLGGSQSSVHSRACIVIVTYLFSVGSYA